MAEGRAERIATEIVVGRETWSWDEVWQGVQESVDRIGQSLLQGRRAPVWFDPAQQRLLGRAPDGYTDPDLWTRA